MEGARREIEFGVKEIITVILILLVGLLIRLYHINKPPLDFQPIRQYQVAHIVRGMYYEGLDSIPKWQKEIAEINKERIGFLLEPRILENIVVFFYRVFGYEALWIPRMISSIFWIAGGFFLYLIGRNLFSLPLSFIALIFYLFLPFSLSASRSFQPDSMMMMLTLIGIYGIVRYFKSPSWTTLIITTIPSSLAILIKPYSIFP
ncbi:MAG: glycosyltransferase family 39 protein, partial [Candidatus Nitrosotenuis sp.]